MQVCVRHKIPTTIYRIKVATITPGFNVAGGRIIREYLALDFVAGGATHVDSFRFSDCSQYLEDGSGGKVRAVHIAPGIDLQDGLCTTGQTLSALVHT